MKIHRAIQVHKHGEAHRLCFAKCLLMTPENNDYQTGTTILEIAMTFLLDQLSVQCPLDALNHFMCPTQFWGDLRFLTQ
jgi:uncharacterized metal-binding protein